MSVVVAIKENGRIYVGSDSQCTKGCSRISLSNPNNYKIWVCKDAPNALMAHTGRLREAQVVKVEGTCIDELDILHNAIDWEYMVKNFVPYMFNEILDKGLGDKEKNCIDSSFLFAYGDKLYLIDCDGVVIEIDDFVAIGSGANEAKGSLLSTAGEDPEERIIKAIKASVASDIYVDYPIIIANTETTQFKVINQTN